MDFLTRAKAKGYDVSDVNYQNGLRWLADFAQRRDENDTDTLSARAYALYVLATVGDENLSALRYVADNQIDKLPTALAQAQIGAALALHGDQTRAADAFKKAQATLKRETGDSGWYGDYGGALRDSAAMVTLAAETKAPGIDPVAVAGPGRGLAGQPAMAFDPGGGLAGHGGRGHEPALDRHEPRGQWQGASRR